MSSAALRAIPAPLLLGAGAVLVLAALGYVAYKRAPAGTFDPTSPANFVYQGASSVTEAITGVKGDTPGFFLSRLLDPAYENFDPNAKPAPAAPALKMPDFYTPDLSPFLHGA